jgi:reductive dehalogenase
VADDYLKFFVITTLTGVSLLLLIISVVLWVQGEKGAAGRLSIPLGVSFLPLFLLPLMGWWPVYIASGSMWVVVLVVVFYRVEPIELPGFSKLSRYDERDIVFSRNELTQGTEKYANYYAAHPQRESVDNRFRQLPGLLSPQAPFYHQRFFEAAIRNFSKVDALQQYVDGEPVAKPVEVIAENECDKIRQMILTMGAHSVGFTHVQPYHYYSVKGRGSRYGEEIAVNHTVAIAFTVEMDKQSVDAAPQASIVAESSRQYLRAAEIATQVAQYIRQRGFAARAHIDGNYEVVCPLVARDAGLGEIGRMGILITPDLGPRVRIGVVTTTLRLQPKIARVDPSVYHFCRLCKKCAVCCPAQAIPHELPVSHRGVVRWRIDDTACFTYWCKVGTDCGRCMAVCPYSHPNTFVHRMVRVGIKKFPLFRIFASWGDDFLYGRKPKPKAMPTCSE